MKAKQSVLAGVFAAMLVTVVACHVVAEDEINAWISRVRLARNGRSSHSDDRVVGMI
jgi:hypothetical protein